MSGSATIKIKYTVDCWRDANISMKR